MSVYQHAQGIKGASWELREQRGLCEGGWSEEALLES